MDEKINLKAVDQYSDRYASRLAADFFGSKQKITGPEILTLCDIRQVNLFILRELMYLWNVERQNLRSPYFDYGAPEVAKALQHFQNVLSNHIAIAKNDFVPLLRKAVSDTLYVILDPYDFYSDTLARDGRTSVNASELRADIKYLKINKQPLERLAEKVEEKKLASVSGNEAFALLDSILEEVNFTPEEIEPYVTAFSAKVPLELALLYDTKTTHPAKGQEPPSPRPVVNHAEEKPKAAVNNFQKINQIKESLTINQKFMFTKILFNGDFEIFSRAIDRLDSFDNIGQALHFLEDQYAEWDKDSDEYLEFRDMLEKRFS